MRGIQSKARQHLIKILSKGESYDIVFNSMADFCGLGRIDAPDGPGDRRVIRWFLGTRDDDRRRASSNRPQTLEQRPAADNCGSTSCDGRRSMTMPDAASVSDMKSRSEIAPVTAEKNAFVAS